MIRYVAKRLLQGGVAAALSLVAFTACRRASEEASVASTVTVLYAADEAVVGPSWDEPAKFLVFLPLVAWNARGELEGRLARSWEHSADYRHWTVHLRTDVRWHDGVPVTAHDVAFTLRLLRNPHVGFAMPPDVTVIDDSTYTLTVEKQSGGTPLDDWTVYYPKHLLEALDPAYIWEWDFWKRPVGNGPYRYVRHVPATMLALEANPQYYRGKPAIERVVLKFGQPSLVELLSGNVDVVRGVNRLDLPKVAGDLRFRAYSSVASDNFVAVLWNTRRAALADPRVRRALTMAVNRRELYGLLGVPEDVPVFDGIPTTAQVRRGEFPDPLRYDPADAGRLLDEAGWRDTDGNGVRDRAGTPLRFAVIVSPQEGNERTAVYLQAQLRRIGARVEVQRVERGVQIARTKAREFDAVITSVIVNLDWYLSPVVLLGERSPLGYVDPEAVQLVGALRTAVSPRAVDRLYARLSAIVRRDLPFTMLHPGVAHFVVHRRLEGLSTPWRADPVWFMEELRVRSPRRRAFR